MAAAQKILPIDDLVRKVARLCERGKKVVQSHGIFDLVHPGVLAHLRAARAAGDVLVVTVIRDRDVRRGPGRPIFPEAMRAENVAALELVDFVAIVDDDTPFEAVRLLKPDVFAKGQAFKERDRIVSEKIFREEKEFYFGNTRIHETDGFSLSASTIINRFLDVYPEETKGYLGGFAREYGFSYIKKHIDALSEMSVLLVGDGIIDEYCYVEPMSKSAKSNLVVHRHLGAETFAGGAFAIANHVSGICGRVHLVTLLGSEDSREEFISGNLRSNVTTRFFHRDDGPTVVKRRYINQYQNQKLFEINHLNDAFVDRAVEDRVLRYIRAEAPKYDLVLVSDFGHGFITKRMIAALRRHSRVLAINTQTNGANAGYNLVTKYDRPSLVCLDEPEVRLASQEKFADIEAIARATARRLGAEGLIVTLGKKGALGVDRTGRVTRAPIFSTRVVDTVGAGDAFFSFTAPCFARGLPMEAVIFVGNAVGALAVQIVGNRKPVEKAEFLSFVHAVLS
jgi:rfaE bifunctional protein nucleotidyltransferase chain/domain